MKTKHKLPEKPKEQDKIVEYSFNEKNQVFVVRFLDGSSYSLKINDLPKKLITKKPNWSRAVLNDSNSSLYVPVGKKYRELPSHLIHLKGKVV